MVTYNVVNEYGNVFFSFKKRIQASWMINELKKRYPKANFQIGEYVVFDFKDNKDFLNWLEEKLKN